jgi:hypothetical protein
MARIKKEKVVPVEEKKIEEAPVETPKEKVEPKEPVTSQVEVKKNLFIQGKAVASYNNKIQGGQIMKEVLDVDGTTFTLTEDEFNKKVIEK